jgi:hypothetical protein
MRKLIAFILLNLMGYRTLYEQQLSCGKFLFAIGKDFKDTDWYEFKVKFSGKKWYLVDDLCLRKVAKGDNGGPGNGDKA